MSRRRNAASDRKRSAADVEARKSGFPPLKSLLFYPQRPRSGAKCRRCGRPSGARKKGARTGCCRKGGAGGERPGEPRGRSPKKPPSGAETARKGKKCSAAVLCDNERGGALGGTTRAKPKPRGHGRGFGRCTAAASQSDCKRVPKGGVPLGSAHRNTTKKKKTRAI